MTGSFRGLPLLEARKISDVDCETEQCPYCGRNHIHGLSPKWEVGHRVAHCVPLKDVSERFFPDMYKWIQDHPGVEKFLANNPGYYVVVVE